MRNATCAICLAVIVAALGAPASAAIESTFDTDADGWIVMDCANGGPWSPIGPYLVNWISAGGDPGGHIDRQDPSTNTYFFQAPAKFLGDRSAYIGQALEFSIRTDIYDYFGADVVVLVGAGMTIVADHGGIDSINTWLDKSIPLVQGNFQYNSLSGAVVSEADFQAVMADLDALRISAEYGDQAGEENTDLDSVRLIPEPATLSLLSLGFLGLLTYAWWGSLRSELEQ